MIYDSFIWKRELKKELNNFRKLIAKMELSEEIGIPDDLTLKIEKFFSYPFLSFANLMKQRDYLTSLMR